MAVEEGWSFSLPEPPESVCYSPSTNSLIACGKEGKISCFDLISGQQLCEAGSSPAKTRCTFNVATGKLVIVNNKCIGARKDFNGIYLLDSILQPPQEDPNAAIILELPLNQVPDLYNELQTLKGKKNISITIKENKADDAKREKWATCCIRGTHKTLMKDFVQPQYDYRSGSVSTMKSIICQLRLRLMLLGQQPNAFSKYECGGDNAGSFNKQSGHMYCEAVRRYSFRNWPHKSYTWAVPDAMAAAGFFLAGSEQHHYGSYSMVDRTLCFCCNVSLHRWEPTDEPWSEHERHSSKCAFIRGEYTENVSISCTEATHPAQCYCPSDVKAEVSCVSSTAEGVGLVAVGNSDGLIVVFDLTKHLMLWETWSFCMDEDRITRGLMLPSQQYESVEQLEKLKQKVDQHKHPEHPHDNEQHHETQKETQQEEKQVEKIKTEEGKEAKKQEEIETEPLHQEDKTSYEKQVEDQEHKAAKDDNGKAASSLTSQQGPPVSSCKLHSLGIVQLTRQEDTRDMNTLPNNNKKDTDSSHVDPSLLVGVSFSRSSGAQDAAIIVYDVHSSPTWKSVAATTTKKTKSKYTATALSSAGIAIEPMGDPLLDMDDVMPSSLPITVDIDTPSWELVPPLPPEPPLMSSTIPPPPPPPPPLKGSNSANKIEKGSQLQIFAVSEYIDDLPNDAHPVVSVIQPCGHSRVAVALEYGSNHGGCVILFNLEHCNGKTILGKSVMFDLKTSDLHVTEMCAMENLETGRTNNTHYLATINKRGSFVVYSMGMNIVISQNFDSDPLAFCFPCVNVGLFGVVTRSGVVKTVKVVGGKPVAEVDVIATSVVDSGAMEDTAIPVNPHKVSFNEVLTSDYLQSCYEATQFATTRMSYIAHAPPGWESISMEQLHKRSPQHVCHMGQTRSNGDAPPLAWQYHLPTGEVNHGDDSHHFDLCFALKTHFGHLDVTFNLYHPDAISQDTLVSLVLHRPKGAADDTSQHHNVICGPVRLQNFIDVVGNTACIKFTHPELMKQQNCICSLVIENLNSNITEMSSKKTTPVDSEVTLHTISRNTSRSKVFRRSLIRKGHNPYRVQSEKPKASEEKKLAVMIKAYPFAKVLTESDLELHQLLINDVVCHESLVLVVTRYQVAKSELENLSPCLQELMEKLQESKDTPCISQKMCYQAFDMLCWIAGVLLYDKTRFCVFLKSIGGLLSSLLYSCFLDDVTPLSLPLKFLRFLHLCGRSEMIDPQAHGLFMDHLLKAILTVLPLVFTMSYKGTLQLFFHIMSSHVGPYRQLEILTACRENLSSLVLQLQPGTELITQLLRAEFDLPVIRRRSLLAHPPPVSLPLGLDTMTAESRYYTNERHSDDTELQLLINSSDSVLVKHTSEASMNNSNTNVWPFPSKSLQYSDAHGAASYIKDSSRSDKGLRNPFFARRFSTTLLETLTLSFTFKSFSHSSMSVVDKPLPSKKEPLDLESLLVSHKNGITVGYHILPPDASKDSDYVPKNIENDDYSKDMGTARTLFSLFDLPCLMRSKQILIENIESGVGYSVVLDLERSTELTNVCLNTSHHRIGSVIVDIWGEDETEESAVRLVQTTDVKSKSITVGSLLPSPVCRYVKITFVVALGANRECIQFPIGLLFGRPLCAIDRPLPSHLIQEIQHRLKSKCYTVQSSLAPMVSLYLDLYHVKKSHQQVLKGLSLSIRELYEACRNAEIQLDRFKRVVIERQDKDDKITQPCIIDLADKAMKTEDIEANRYEIIAQYLVSVSVIILGQKSALSLMDTTDDESSATDNIPLILDPRLPKWCLQFTHEQCRTLFYSLCVHGVADEQVRVCVFLVQACGAEQWWSSFITDTFLDLFCSNPSQVFSKEKVFLIISTMIQKTLSPEMLSCLMKAAGRLLSPLKDGDNDEGSLDMEQIEWLLFLFSHILSSVGATGITQNGIILPGASASQVSNTSYAHKLNEIENQIKEKQNRIEQLGSKAFSQGGNGDKTFLLKKVQEIKEQTERERAALSEDANKIRKHLDEKNKQDSDDRTVVSLVMLSAVADDVKQELARGIMSLIVSYINGNVSIDAVLGACSTLSHLVDSCSTSLQLSCLITSVQFCQLLSFCISWQSARAGNSDPQQGKLQWMCRSVVSLISQIVRNEYVSYLQHTIITAMLADTVDVHDFTVQTISENTVKDKVAVDSNEDETDSAKVAGTSIPVVGSSSTKSTFDSSETTPQKLSARLAAMSVYSSAIDYRLVNSFNLLAEKDYQHITNAEFEHIITAIRHSGNVHQHQKFQYDSTSSSSTDQFDIHASSQTADMLTDALNDLLSQAHNSLSTITLVDVLEFWNSLILVDPTKLPRSPNSNTTKGDNPNTTVLFFSLELVDAMLHYIVHATIPILLQTWQLVFSFLSNMLRVNKCDSKGTDNFLNSPLLGKVLVKFFTQKWSTNPLVEAREESGCQLEESFSSFFTEVVNIVCVNQDLSVVCGLQLLMDVLSDSLSVLFQCSGSTFTLMLFAERFCSEVSLTRTLSQLDEKPAQKLLHSFSNLFLCSVKFVKSYLNYSQRDQFELRGTESRVQRHHYMREETTTWIKCLSDGHFVGKLSSYLLQSVRQLSSETNVTEKALNALLIFTGQPKSSSTEENHNTTTLSYTVTQYPFLEILFSNEELLYNILTTLNSNISSQHALLSKPKATKILPTAASSDGFVLHIFQNFVQSIVSNCTNMSCFLKPSLRCLKDSLSSHSQGYGLSTLIAGILAKIFDVPSSGNEQLVQFLKLGGADLVFQGLIRSCQFNRKVGKSIFSSTMAQVTKSDLLQPTSKDGNLVNFAPLAAVRLLSNSATQSINTRLQGLVGGLPTYSSSRSAVIVTTDNMFVNGWLNVGLKLPYPILLHTVQVFHPSNSSYSNSSPSMMALGILHQSNNSPPLPVVSPVITGGIHCQELKLSQPKPAQEIVIYLRRPTNDGQLSLSQISILGTDLLNDTLSEDSKTTEEHPSTGWLNLLCDWMPSSCGEEIISLLLAQAKTQTNALVNSSLKFLQESTNLELCSKMEQFLLFLSTKLEEFRTTLLRQLMGINTQRTPSSSNATIQLLYKLCANSPNNLLFSAVGWLAQPTVASRLPATHVRAISSAVWLHRGEENLELLLSQDIFSSLLEYTISLEVTSSTKSAMCSLLCAICTTIPSFFIMFVKSTRPLYDRPDDLDAKLLYCTAMLCSNNGCLITLWDSGAVMIICERLKEIFLKLNNSHEIAPTNKDFDETAVNSCLVVACRLLAFLTQLVSNHLEAKNLLLETDRVCDFWKPMMEYLVCHHKAYSKAKNVFFLQVVTKFFRECMCLHAASKIAFVKILIDLMLCNGTGDPVITPLLYNLIISFIFNMDYVPVVVDIEKIPSDLMLPSHLVRTYDSQQFHPSFVISTTSFIIHCPLYSSTLRHLQEYCLSNASCSGSSAPPPKQESYQSKKSPEHAFPDDMYYWYNENEEFYTSPGNYIPTPLKHKLRSKTSTDKPEKPTSSSPEYKMLFGKDTEMFQLNVKLLALFSRRQPPSHLPYVLKCSIVEGKSVSGDAGVAEPDLKKTAATDLIDSLSIFIEERGLQLVSKCLPFLYKHFWPKEEIYQHHDKTVMLTVSNKPEQPLLRPHVLSSLPNCIPFHSLFMLGLCLRIKYFSLALSGQTITFMMLRALLGIESGVNQDLTFEPYNQFQCILADNPVGTDIGNTVREEAFTIGVIHHLLHCLSIAGHHASRCREKDSTISSSSAFRISNSGGDSTQPSSVAVEGKQYWAKGTGFGTGSFNSKWNMKETVTKQQQEEALVTILFELLGKYFKVLGGTTDVDCFSSGLSDVCANSCLLPALASYLHNDSVLDMSKHIMLYMSVMRLLQGISSNLILRSLLLVNYSTPEATTSSGQTLAKLLAQLKETVTKYCKTVRIGDKTKTKSSSDTELGSENQTGPPLPPRDDQKMKEKGSLNELIASIKVTCELVAHMAQELKHQESEEGKDSESSGQPTQTLDEFYMETMKPLQFGTCCIVAEDENGQNVLHVPYHYSDRVVTSTSAQMSATKARRLAQEIATLSTSLPLSPSSSVFVRCDEEQLDVMKVLITGPADTPYANGCFLCDVFFPVEYPNKPMLVNLVTTGNNTVRFNPNLYADGKVCLSILNTWQGRPEEKWNAQTSSFLQVLVSIQSLILVPEPYFNEPGYEQYRGSSYGNKRCLVYNGELYCNTMKWAIIEQIRNPDPCFKEVIYRHYHIRKDEVLRQCRKWQKELESAVEKYHDDSSILKQIKAQLNRISQLLPTLQHVLYNSIDLSEFDKKEDKEKEDKIGEENS